MDVFGNGIQLHQHRCHVVMDLSQQSVFRMRRDGLELLWRSNNDVGMLTMMEGGHVDFMPVLFERGEEHFQQVVGILFRVAGRVAEVVLPLGDDFDSVLGHVLFLGGRLFRSRVGLGLLGGQRFEGHGLALVAAFPAAVVELGALDPHSGLEAFVVTHPHV